MVYFHLFQLVQIIYSVIWTFAGRILGAKFIKRFFQQIV